MLKQKQKNLIFQVNIKNPNVKTAGAKTFHYIDDLFKFSNQRAKQYADKVGADYFCLTDSNWLGKDVGPAYHKLFAYKLFELGYDNIFWIDSDAIFTPLAPNVFKQFNQFSAVREYTKYQNANKRIGIDPKWHYFMSGQMMLTRDFYNATKDDWYNVFKQHLNNKFAKHDQGIFNVLVYKHLKKYTDMGGEWGSWEKVGKYIRHFFGYTKKNWDKQKYLNWEEKLVKKSA